MGREQEGSGLAAHEVPSTFQRHGHWRGDCTTPKIGPEPFHLHFPSVKTADLRGCAQHQAEHTSPTPHSPGCRASPMTEFLQKHYGRQAHQLRAAESLFHYDDDDVVWIIIQLLMLAGSTGNPHNSLQHLSDSTHEPASQF